MNSVIGHGLTSLMHSPMWYLHSSSIFTTALLSRRCVVSACDFVEPSVSIHLGADFPCTSVLFLVSVVLMPHMVGDIGDLMPPTRANESSGHWNFKFYM